MSTWDAGLFYLMTTDWTADVFQSKARSMTVFEEW